MTPDETPGRAAQAFSYSVDLVLCLDVSIRMRPAVDVIAAGIARLHDDLTAAMAAKGKAVDRLRARVVTFRERAPGATQAMVPSGFLRLPAESAVLADLLTGIRSARRQGDGPASGLEALTVAMRSDWSRDGSKSRHIVVLWTDAAARPLEEGERPGMPPDFDALTDLWDRDLMAPDAKRLVLYGPDAYPWTDIANFWDNALHMPLPPGGCAEVEFGEVFDTIASSI